MIPPADSDMSAHRTRTNRKDDPVDTTHTPYAADQDAYDPPCPPMPATAHVRLQEAAR